MAYTTPPTFVAGNTLTAAQLNTYLRDNFKALGDPWTAYGSGASWTATTTNPVLNNGTWIGKYIQINKLVKFYAQITIGSTTTFGSGQYQIALPVAPLSGPRFTFTGHIQDFGTGNHPLWGINQTGSTVDLRHLPATAGAAFLATGPTSPITLTTNDVIFLSGEYEAA